MIEFVRVDGVEYAGELDGVRRSFELRYEDTELRTTSADPPSVCEVTSDVANLQPLLACLAMGASDASNTSYIELSASDQTDNYFRDWTHYSVAIWITEDKRIAIAMRTTRMRNDSVM